MPSKVEINNSGGHFFSPRIQRKIWDWQRISTRLYLASCDDKLGHGRQSLFFARKKMGFYSKRWRFSISKLSKKKNLVWSWLFNLFWGIILPNIWRFTRSQYKDHYEPSTMGWERGFFRWLDSCGDVSKLGTPQMHWGWLSWATTISR